MKKKCSFKQQQQWIDLLGKHDGAHVTTTS